MLLLSPLNLKTCTIWGLATQCYVDVLYTDLFIGANELRDYRQNLSNVIILTSPISLAKNTQPEKQLLEIYVVILVKGALTEVVR